MAFPPCALSLVLTPEVVFMTKLSFGNLTTNMTFSLVNEYGAINSGEIEDLRDQIFLLIRLSFFYLYVPFSSIIVPVKVTFVLGSLGTQKPSTSSFLGRFSNKRSSSTNQSAFCLFHFSHC